MEERARPSAQSREDHPLGHVGVDLAGQFDEAGAEAVFARLPGEIEGVDGDAVTAKAGPGVVGGEAEGLGGGGADDFVDVDAHAVADDFEMVNWPAISMTSMQERQCPPPPMRRRGVMLRQFAFQSLPEDLKGQLNAPGANLRELPIYPHPMQTHKCLLHNYPGCYAKP